MSNLLIREREIGFYECDRLTVGNEISPRTTGSWARSYREAFEESAPVYLMKGIPSTEKHVSQSPGGPPLYEEVLDMVKMFSHDLRGPLVSMGAALKLLKKGAYGEIQGKVTREIDKLFTMVTGLIGTVEDFLGKAFSVDGDLDMDREVLHLKKDVIEPVLLELSKDILDRCIIVDDRLISVPDHKLQIQGNRFLLKAVFRNLLKNAMKYGDRGCVIAIGFKNLGSHFRINVYNSGSPVPKEYRDLLFTKFRRISSKNDGNEGGMGLGLYLVKEIIRKHGGKIWYEAKEHGSNFVFTLPKF